MRRKSDASQDGDDIDPDDPNATPNAVVGFHDGEAKEMKEREVFARDAATSNASGTGSIPQLSSTPVSSNPAAIAAAPVEPAPKALSPSSYGTPLVEVFDIPPVHEQLEFDLGNRCGSLGFVMLLDVTSRVGKYVWRYSRNSRMDSKLTPESVVGVSSVVDVETAFLFVVNKMKQQKTSRRSPDLLASNFKIVLAGSDVFLGALMRPLVELVGKEPREWGNLAIHLFPMFTSPDAPDENRIADFISSEDMTFKSIFYSSEWKAASDPKKNVDSVMDMIEGSITRYVTGGNNIRRLPIATAMVDIEHPESKMDTSERISIPFIKSMVIGSVPGPNASPVGKYSVTLDYWIYHPERDKVQKHSFKGDLSYLEVSRLHHYPNDIKDNSGNITDDEKNKSDAEAPHKPVPATPPDDDVLSPEPDKDHKCLLMTLRLASARRKFSRLPSKSPKKTTESTIIRAYVSRLVLSCADGSPLAIYIDGIQRTHVKFVSISPQWGSKIKVLPVAVFEIV
jgi:hypothetical protein